MTEEVKEHLSKSELDQLCINTIRFLSVDAVQKADSGHPGLPLDAAPMGYALWTQFLKFNPKNPDWFNRDRFILSAGHGSALLYSLLYLTGYDLSLDQIKQFRQWGSKTPGHPEHLDTPGVEVTTGPLGQGFGNGVGMAIVEANLAARFNRPNHQIIDHYTYAIVSDGDLMEGVASEAASLAGDLKLGKLIYLYDSNHVTLSAGTNITFNEDVGKRFEAYGWHVQHVEDGNDLEAITNAIYAARRETEKPSLIIIRTHIGYGSPNKQDTYEAHGSPLGEEEVKLTKENLGWPEEPPFFVPEQALAHFRQAVAKGEHEESRWHAHFFNYADDYPELAEELQEIMQGKLPEGWEANLPSFSPDDGPLATRVASEKVINAIAPHLPALIGGSADLDPSTHNQMKGLGDFQNPARAEGDQQGSAGGGWSYAGRNLHFGVREHAMGAIVNGMAAHGGALPFGATFLIFSDYMRPSIRLAALMKLHLIYIFTHDSIALGEDGPTHQPVEQLVSLRAIPHLLVMRPADANEAAAAWRVAIEQKERPVALVFTRQKLPILPLAKHSDIPLGVRSGGYVISHAEHKGEPDISLVATGSEVHLALESQEKLKQKGIQARVVSLPCWKLFEEQPEEYQNKVLPPQVPILAIEAGSPLGWKSYVGPHIDVIGVDRFGASAPGKIVMDKYGFNVDNVIAHVETILEKHD